MEDSRAAGDVIEFRTLGGVTLSAGSGPERRSISLPPKPLALLAYLSVECPHGHRRRDDLVGLLWPELPDDRARAGLSQTLYRLKQEVGPEAVLAHGQDVVCVDTDALWCDAVEFQSALDDGRSRDALALYKGPFLEGFHLSDTEGFDHWLSQTRKRLQERAVAAARDLARGSEEAGDLDEAIRFALQALDLGPYDETAVRHLMRLFDGRGDRSQALSAYERFAARLQDELDVEPSPETEELVERIKLRKEGNLPAPEVGNGSGLREPRGSAPVPLAAELVDGREAVGRRPWSRGFLLGLAATAAAVTTLALVFGSRRSTPLRPDHVFVAGVANLTGDSALDQVATSMTERVLSSLSLMDFVTPIMAVDPGEAVDPDEDAGKSGSRGLELRNAFLMEAAREAGAGTLFLGTLGSTGDSLSLRSQVIDVARGEVLRGVELGAASPLSIEEALDGLSQEVAWAVGRRTDPRLAGWERLADRKPRFDAYLEFVEGVEVYLGSAGFRQPEGAIEYFERASRMDSTFYSPRVWSVIAHSYMGNADLAQSMAEELSGGSDRLPLTDRYILDSWAATQEGQSGRALSVIRRAMILSPEGEYMPLAVLAALNAEHYQEAVRWMTGVDTARGWAAYWGLYSMSLAEGYHQLGMHKQELEPARRTALDAPANMYLQMPEVRALAELGSRELEARLEEILGRADAPYLRGEALCLAATESQGHGHREIGEALLNRCIQWDKEHLEVDGDAARVRLGQTLVLGGRLAEARTYLEPLAETRADNPHVLGPLGVLEALDGNPEEAGRIMEYLRELDPPAPAWGLRKLYWQAVIAAHSGQPDDAIRLLGELAEAGGRRPDPRDLFLEPLWDHPLFVQLVEVTG